MQNACPHRNPQNGGLLEVGWRPHPSGRVSASARLLQQVPPGLLLLLHGESPHAGGTRSDLADPGHLAGRRLRREGPWDVCELLRSSGWCSEQTCTCLTSSCSFRKHDLHMAQKYRRLPSAEASGKTGRDLRNAHSALSPSDSSLPTKTPWAGIMIPTFAQEEIAAQRG